MHIVHAPTGLQKLARDLDARISCMHPLASKILRPNSGRDLDTRKSFVHPLASKNYSSGPNLCIDLDTRVSFVHPLASNN